MYEDIDFAGAISQLLLSRTWWSSCRQRAIL